jgi:NADH:ubiquinone oxidoreductase subunit 2 (subunit N)
MKIAHSIFLIIHLLSVAGIVLLLLRQAGKDNKVVPKGLTHAALTALVAGLALVGIRDAQHHQHPAQYAAYNYGTIAAKLVVLIVILALAYKQQKQESISRSSWATLLLLTVLNIGLAGTLK